MAEKGYQKNTLTITGLPQNLVLRGAMVYGLLHHHSGRFDAPTGNVTHSLFKKGLVNAQGGLTALGLEVVGQIEPLFEEVPVD